MNYLAVIFGIGFLLFAPPASAQYTPHNITAVNREGDSIQLAFNGSPSSIFRAYFDLFTIQDTPDLNSWNICNIVAKTNSLNAPLIFNAGNFGQQRFFKTLPNLEPTAFPVGAGSYFVGEESILLTDLSRSNRYTAGNSSFMMTVWYPARPVIDSARPKYLEQNAVPIFSQLFSLDPQLLGGFYSPTFANAPVNESHGPYPLVLYSHGFRVNRRDNSERCIQLASHGYVVAALDHSDALATVFPDEKVYQTSITSLSTNLFQNNLRDLRFALDYFAAHENSKFEGAIDLSRVGAFGWSYGGGVAAELCRSDIRVKAVVLLDAYLQNAHDVAWEGVQKPVLGIYNSTSFFTTPYDQTGHDAYWMKISGAEHQHFADWLAWLVSPTETSRNNARVINACALSFFDLFLKGQTDHLLDNPQATFPEISDFMRK